MLNKGDYSDLETGAGDWRALTGSNPAAGSAEDCPPPPSWAAALPPPCLSALLRQAGKQQKEHWVAMRASLPCPPPVSPWCSDPPCQTLLPCQESVSLACSERPGPEEWQGTEDSVLFVLSPQTHISFVLFFGRQTPELVSFLFFSPSFSLPHLPAYKAKLSGKGQTTAGFSRQNQGGWFQLIKYFRPHWRYGNRSLILGPFPGWWLSVFSSGSRDPCLI